MASHQFADWKWFRGLYLHLMYELPLRSVPAYLLEPDVLARAHAILLPLERYRHRNSVQNPYEVRQEDLWELYALSRINDFLLFPFHGSNIGTEQAQTRLRMFEALGFTEVEERPFHPYYHEIVDAGRKKARQPEPQIARQRWAGLRFGELLFARAGVDLTYPGDCLDPLVVERSTLYWTYRRYARRTEDLSVGWGSNSQWRTGFRRDYEGGGNLHFNVDGHFDLASREALAHSVQRAGRQDLQARLSLAHRRELLVYRCFVSSRRTMPATVWPYDDTLSVLEGSPNWPWEATYSVDDWRLRQPG